MKKEQRREYVFDKASMSFKQATRSIWRPLRRILSVVLVSLSLSVVAYLFLAAFINTDTDKRLKKENRMYEQLYSTLLPKESLIAGTVTGLQVKDDRIYEEVFHASAPDVDPLNSLEFLFGADTIPDTKVVSYSTAKADAMMKTAVEVDAAFDRIFSSLASEGSVMPPMTLPLDNISYPQIGASRGSRMNPFLKAFVQHDGIDFIAPRGDKVRASANGTVINVTSSSKGLGKYVEIEHEGGYVTRYAHLSEISVTKGQKVEKGRKIGLVGMSGSAFAPHLHYEVLKDGVPMDPVNYLFASVGPEEYANMLFMSINTKQSMD